MHVFAAIYWVIVGIIWLAIAFWPARVAARKGQSFLFFFPLSLLVALLMKDHSQPTASA
jgi:hypothetical protein